MTNEHRGAGRVWFEVCDNVQYNQSHRTHFYSIKSVYIYRLHIYMHVYASTRDRNMARFNLLSKSKKKIIEKFKHNAEGIQSVTFNDYSFNALS